MQCKLNEDWHKLKIKIPLIHNHGHKLCLNQLNFQVTENKIEILVL